MNSSDEFAKNLATLLDLSEEKSVKLAELMDDRMKELADEVSRDSLDREFKRGDYDPDY